MITSVIFNGKNYDLWEKVLQTALKAKNKLGFVEQKLKKLVPKEGKDMTEL